MLNIMVNTLIIPAMIMERGKNVPIRLVKQLFNSSLPENSRKRLPVIAFVIPTHNHSLRRITSEIVQNFSEQKHYLIVVNDGSTKKVFIPKGALTVQHTRKLGLAQSLLSGYRKAVELPVDYMVRADADGEYPLYPVREIIGKLEVSPSIAGSFIELKRDRESNGLVDALFHKIMGYIEGLIILGKPMYQHSPGLQIYKKETIVSILPKIERFIETQPQGWGLDLAVIKLASIEGEIITVKIDKHGWRERRPFGKIIRQAMDALSTLKKINTSEFLS